MSEWRECRLDQVVKFQRGHDLTVQNICNGDYPVAGSNGIIGYHDAFTTQGPGVTLGRSGNSIGVVHYYNKNFWAHNTTLYSTEFIDSYPKYIYYFLKEIDFTSFNTGSAVPSLNRNHIHSLKVKTPPLPEQKAIAAVLSSLDDKIDLLHRQNATLEAMAEALFRQWFVVEAKEEWEDITVADVAILNQQTKNKDYPYPAIQYLDTGSLTEGVIEGFQSYPFNDAPSRAQRLVNHNDILISLVRPNQKHYGIIKNPPSNLVVSTGFCVLTCKYMNPYFLYLFLTSNEMTEFLHSVAEGSTSAYPALISSDIAKLELKRPPADKLVEFGNYADSAWEKITQNQTQIRTLEKFRDTLLPKLMSGEVRVAC